MVQNDKTQLYKKKSFYAFESDFILNDPQLIYIKNIIVDSLQEYRAITVKTVRSAAVLMKKNYFV